MKKNVVIGQSGGPTAVINNSIRGVIDVLKKSEKINKIYGAKMGILGVLKEELLDISVQDRKQIALLSNTPSAGVFGSCRYKIKSNEDMERILEVFEKQNVGYFFYCGGNDSMDTADKINKLAKEKSLDLICTGIAKTIDNDVGGQLQEDGTFAICDHDPGYGSTARSTTINILEANEEIKASCSFSPVLVIGVMGRKIGFIAASARLADPGRNMPLLIILPEAFNKYTPEENLQYITQKVNEKILECGKCIVVISEGVNLGDLNVLKDSFGHVEFGGSGTGVEQIFGNYLNGMDRKDENGRAQSRLAIRGFARWERPGTKQRRDYFTISGIDLKEAYNVGKNAANLALNGESGFMSTILRKPGRTYNVIYDKIPLTVVANSERKFPEEWVTSDRIDVTDDFVKWAMPLIGGNIPEFADFRESYAKKGCGEYTPIEFR
ncbi:MAG: diphosphate--fructose-6-phosphate 1-phosphotransferase [Candidatus Omnitrophica bacterium]|nr:diphosphate--fructose-6-phosphate 1-phosphotransferase [Candidatus Omnitrophota bacterium]